MRPQYCILIFLKNKKQNSNFAKQMHSFLSTVDETQHISQKEFETINWLPIKERYNQCVNSLAFKYFDNQCPHYLNESFYKSTRI